MVETFFATAHKSYPDKYTPVQVGSYIYSGLLKQLQNGEKLSLIIPIILYHGKERWEYRTLSGLFGDLDPAWRKYLPDFDYLYHNLGAISDQEIEAVNNRFLRASFLALKHSFEKDWLGANVKRLWRLSEGSSHELRLGFVYYLSNQGMKEEVLKKITEAWKADVREDSIAGYLMRQGREEGRAKGREEGREVGREEGLQEAARTMIRKGYSDAQICDLLGFTAERVAQLRSEEG